ncbi:kinesin-like protein KIF14 isoform X2 [Coccinella septempunctata]|uniref:kinesin-like protein KIF14 isoform X2 n=1 Tax=Coccinella septempunctata TaxID=41139 RepID=UPI001D0648EB|nr:kinesin-like protein KIF14 isoform X2 [Coccinella septempunctata]
MRNKEMEFLATSTPKKAVKVQTSLKLGEQTVNQIPKSKICYPSPINTNDGQNGKETISDSPRTSQDSGIATKTQIFQGDSKGDEADVNKISVAVRIRPISSREILNGGEKNIIDIRNNALYVDAGARKKINMYKFNVDHIFQSFDENYPAYVSQEKIYQCIGAPLLESAFKGYNACLLAYGQTGSGKSFSMMGRSDADIDSNEYSGIIPRFCRDLIVRTNNLPDNSSANLKISYFEIYNEKIYDLLVVEDISKRNTLKVRENPISGAYVENLSIKDVRTYEEIRLWLLIGNKNRAIAATSMNEQSSRSHSIFRVELNFLNGFDNGDEDSRSRKSSVSLVDLAGNERLVNDKSRNSNKENTQRLEEKHRESISINKSLLTLAHVISSLADKKTHAPYRDSVLTRLLKDSIGGNSLTTMLTTISPSNLCLEETLATLRFACKAQQIVNKAQVNENPQEKIIRDLKSQVLKLKLLQSNYENTMNSEKFLQLDERNESQIRELEKLRIRLNETESKLAEAEVTWKKKFEESKAAQLTSYVQLENLKEELESKRRILSDYSKSIELTPYKSNFLEELECVLKDNIETNISSEFSIVTDWCRKNYVNYYSNSQSDLILTDYKNKKQATLTLKDLNCLGKYKSVDDMMKNINWRFTKSKKLQEKDIISSINILYRSLAHIQPPDINEDLDILYATINKSVQKYEHLLLNLIQKGELRNEQNLYENSLMND